MLFNVTLMCVFQSKFTGFKVTQESTGFNTSQRESHHRGRATSNCKTAHREAEEPDEVSMRSISGGCRTVNTTQIQQVSHVFFPGFPFFVSISHDFRFSKGGTSV